MGNKKKVFSNYRTSVEKICNRGWPSHVISGFDLFELAEQSEYLTKKDELSNPYNGLMIKVHAKAINKLIKSISDKDARRDKEVVKI